MAKKSVVERNRKRTRMARQYAAKRARLKTIASDPNEPQEERFRARQKLAQLPRNSAPSRVRLRCEVTGRGRGNYRKFRLCRIVLRDMASKGQVPGMVKSSW